MADHVGQQIGNYRLIRLLADGGLASIYLGEHVYLKTQVLVELFHTELSSNETESFFSEARVIAHLDHPHIVRVLDFGIERGIPFLVKLYASNISLRQRYPEGTQVPLATTISYTKQVAEALQYAHDRNIIHRDVKPENMLLERNNEILLDDFGIAFSIQSSQSLTGSQMVAGTMAYMAPEQLQGNPRPASDQYSLGVVVYEWLSGDQPFHGSFFEIVNQQMNVPPPPLRQKVPTIPRDVEEVVMIALARDPNQRFGSVQAFANALEQASKPTAVENKIENPANLVLRSDNGEVLQEYLLDKLEMSIGRAPSNDILLSKDNLASRRHAIICYENGEYVLRDERSANGTFVNGQQLEETIPRTLRDNDHIGIGKHELVFHEYKFNSAPLLQAQMESTPTSIAYSASITPNAYLTREDKSLTLANNGEFSTRSMGDSQAEVAQQYGSPPAPPPRQSLPLPAPVVVSPGSSTQAPAGSGAGYGSYSTLSPAPPIPSKSTSPGLSSIFKAAGDALDRIFSGTGKRREKETQLSLFAITRATLENDDRALVGQIYVVEAGISGNRTENFRAEPFNITVSNPAAPLQFDMLVHTSDNIELITEWQKRLSYYPLNPDPQLVQFTFKVVAPGQSFVSIDFYHQRRWLRTVRLTFDAVQQPQRTVVSPKV